MGKKTSVAILKLAYCFDILFFLKKRSAYIRERIAEDKSIILPESNNACAYQNLCFYTLLKVTTWYIRPFRKASIILAHMYTYKHTSNFLYYIVGPEKLKPRTLEIFEQNHVFFADTAVGHRNWAHWYLPNFQVAVLHCITYIANGMIYYCVKSTLSYSSLVCMV